MNTWMIWGGLYTPIFGLTPKYWFPPPGLAPLILTKLSGWRPLDLDPVDEKKTSGVSRYLSLWKPLPNASVEER